MRGSIGRHMTDEEIRHERASIPDDIWATATLLALETRGGRGDIHAGYVLPIAKALLAERKNAAWADWTDPAHIEARIRAYTEIDRKASQANPIELDPVLNAERN